MHNGRLRRASIEAVTVVELQALSRRNLNILLNEYPEVAEELKGVAKHRAKLAKGSSTSTTPPAVLSSASSSSSSPNTTLVETTHQALGTDNASAPQPIEAPPPFSNSSGNDHQENRQDLDSTNARKMELLLTQLENTLQQLNALRIVGANEEVT